MLPYVVIEVHSSHFRPSSRCQWIDPVGCNTDSRLTTGSRLPQAAGGEVPFSRQGGRQGAALRQGVGREGFGWSGTTHVGRKAQWPTWTPPREMIKRQPWLAKYSAGMPGGPNNPLGARAIYLFEGERDTLYRIHGSNEPWTIGQAVSSGCFRMRNEDVQELYEQVEIGAKVVVL